MNARGEREALADLLTGITDTIVAIGEDKILIGDLPSNAVEMATFDMTQRAGSRSLIKSAEQMQNLIARSLRAILLLEQIDPQGWSPRAIADRAESLGLLASSDEWSDFVRLRNRLTHDYPTEHPKRFATLTEVWLATDRLIDLARGVLAYADGKLGVAPRG